jgi:DNA-nicking Smr family endonuclease
VRTRSSSPGKLVLDLHPIFRNNRDIDVALNRALLEAAFGNAQTLEIIPGKGSGQLKKRVLTFLAQKHVRELYDHAQVKPGNEGRILVHFRDRGGPAAPKPPSSSAPWWRRAWS